jgi:hypothetical protein
MAELPMRSEKPSSSSSRPSSDPKAVLDQGIAITGDLTVKLMGLRLLPVRVRLLISSTQLASELGLDWWRDEASGKGKRAATQPKSRSNGRSARPTHRRDTIDEPRRMRSRRS